MSGKITYEEYIEQLQKLNEKQAFRESLAAQRYMKAVEKTKKGRSKFCLKKERSQIVISSLENILKKAGE